MLLVIKTEAREKAEKNKDQCATALDSGAPNFSQAVFHGTV